MTLLPDAFGDLSEKHQKMLMVESGISPELILTRGYRTVTRKTEVSDLGFKGSQARAPALIIPIWSTQGISETYQIRPDHPRLNEDGKYVKYELPKGREMLLDVPPPAWHYLGDPDVPLFITEGVKKADSAVSHGLCCIDLLGVWNFRGVNPAGGLTILPDWEYVAFKSRTHPRDIYITYDSDVMAKRSVWSALNRLHGLCKDRGARPWLIYLPDGPKHKKQGLDDWLVSQKEGITPDEIKWLLRGMAVEELRPLPRDEKAEAEQNDTFPGNLRSRYEPSPGGLWYFRQTTRGQEKSQATNFDCRVLRHIRKDDGLEVTSFLEVSATRNHHKWTGRLTHAEFLTMDWPSKHLMAAAGTLPGQGNRDHSAFGFLQLSEPIEEVFMYGHTGWRHVADEWLFLHAGGAIGRKGEVPEVTVDLEKMTEYQLPAPPDLATPAGKDAVVDAIRRSLGFLNIADRAQSWPLLSVAYTAPLATLFPCDFTVWLQGASGARKSTVAALLLCHFGKFTRNTLPGNFTSTPNAVEIQAFQTKDVIFVLDDYAPSVDRKEAAHQDAVAQRIIRATGDTRGRNRATKEAGLSGERAPRCLPLVTSELPPPGAQSTEARTFGILWEKHAVDDKALAAACAQDGEAYALAMAAYIQYLAGCLDELRPRLAEDVRRLREWFPGEHGRVKESASKLAVGVAAFLGFALRVGAITEVERSQLYEEATARLAACAELTGASQLERRPTVMFCEIIRSALRSGNGYLADKTAGGCPSHNPGQWGWTKLHQGESGFRDGAEKLGWLDRDKHLVYLLPEACFKTVVRHCQQLELRFPDQRKSLGAALDREGYLVLKSKKAGVHYNAWVERSNEQCWALSIDSIYPPAPDESAGADEPLQ
jgi:hypothetical protein